MRSLLLLMMIVVAGCAARPTLTELHDEALRTGDWSEVEVREKSMQRLRRSESADCPGGAAKICVDNGGTPYCQCRGGHITVGTIGK